MSNQNKYDIPAFVVPKDKVFGVWDDFTGGLIVADNTQEFVTKDSGERQQFSTGMVRDTSANKIRYDLVYMPMLKRWAELMTRGAIKYSANNWKKASTQEELDRSKKVHSGTL